MGCWHGSRGCGRWFGGSYEDWCDEMDRPARRSAWRGRRVDRELAADVLEATLTELRDEVRQVRAELDSLRRAGRS